MAQKENTSFHFPHRLRDKDSLFGEKSNSPDSSGDVSVYLFVFLAPSQSPHARDKRGEEKSSNHARGKQKQPSRSSAFSTIGCESVRWLRPEWLRATGGCWNKLIQVCDCSSRPAPPTPHHPRYTWTTWAICLWNPSQLLALSSFVLLMPALFKESHL